MERKKKLLESLLFLENNPISKFDLEQMLEIGPLELGTLVEQLEESLENRGSALRIDRIEDQIYLRPRQEYVTDLAEIYGQKQKNRFSKSAMEILSIVAWKQPVTRSEIDAIRGVDSSNGVRNLIGEGYIRVVGKKDLPGKPRTYGTTEKFLRYFQLGSLEELPQIDDLKEFYEA